MLNIPVTDSYFDDMNLAQWHWYAEMFKKEESQENEKMIACIEYLASFTNQKAVKQIQKNREEAKKHKFQTDDEFKEFTETKTYKENPLIKMMQQLRANEIKEKPAPINLKSLMEGKK